MRIWVMAAFLFIIMAVAGAQESTPRQIADIEVDSQGNLYVLDSFRDEVLLLGKDGKLLKWGSLAGENEKPSNTLQLVRLTSPPSVAAISSNGLGVRDVTDPKAIHTIFPPFANDRIVGMDAQGRLYYPNRDRNRVERYEVGDKSSVISDPGISLKQSGTAACTLVIDGNVQGPAHFEHPYRIDIDALGNIWILDESDTENVFDGQGKFLREIKGPDSKNQSFHRIVDMESDAKGNTYFACLESKDILKYDRMGNLVKIKTGWARALGMDTTGRFYVCGDPAVVGDFPRIRIVPAIKALDETGHLLYTIVVPETPKQ